ncbi:MULTISPECIES: enhanced intracellular survival protein Eis [unclassified Streptomyces]|uniref:GNAT family N-acetyltransferase n=1 Tax=unclassified Streptomyces TaxID=2593676 RepID=UPI00365DA499
MNSPITFHQADDDLCQQYDALATRSFGHPLSDIAHLRPHADIRVATRSGTVVAGGLGLLIPQHFGGAPVPSACLGAGCVAPEERGSRLAARLLTERLHALQAQGAVISSLWTASTGYARHLGWEAPAPVTAWSIATDDLKQAATTRKTDHLDITHGLTPDAEELQQDLARQWNGPVQRPHWWAAWTTARHALTTYRFHRPGQPPTGVLAFAMTPREQHGMHLAVHDFWATDQHTADAMLAFLGRHDRAATITFQRNALPPSPLLLHTLHRYRPHVRAWHPWMLRILNLPEAIRLRGWPADLDLSVPIEVEGESHNTSDRYLLHIEAGSAELRPTSREAAVSFTRGQLAVWYAGGYRSTTTARLSGIECTSSQALTNLIHATTDQEPWLPDHF